MMTKDSSVSEPETLMDITISSNTCDVGTDPETYLTQ